MKSAKRFTMALGLILLAVMLTASNGLCSTTGFGGGSSEGPMGLAIQGNAPGVKLAGIMCLELYNPHQVDGVDVSDGYAIVRLRKSNIVHTFYAEIFDVPVDAPGHAQDAIMEALADEIREVFFDGDSTVELVLRNVEEWGSVVGDRGVRTDAPGVAYDYTVADIVVAGK